MWSARIMSVANRCSTETAQFYKIDSDCTFYLDLFHASTNHLTSSFSCSKSSFLFSTVSNLGFLLSLCIYSSYLTNLTPSAEFQLQLLQCSSHHHPLFLVSCSHHQSLVVHHSCHLFLYVYSCSISWGWRNRQSHLSGGSSTWYLTLSIYKPWSFLVQWEISFIVFFPNTFYQWIQTSNELFHGVAMYANKSDNKRQ